MAILSLMKIISLLYLKKKMGQTEKYLYVHLSFHYYHYYNQHPPHYGREEYPHHANGFMNQIQSLVNAFQIAEKLGRRLVVDGFHLDIRNRERKIPLSRVMDFSSFPIPCLDISMGEIDRYHLSQFSHQMIHRPKNEWLRDVIQTEGHHSHLEIDCCFYFCFDRALYRLHLRQLRFAPIFYDMITPFVESIPNNDRFHVVHYRLEDDFSAYFSTLTRPTIPPHILSRRLWRLYDRYMSYLRSVGSPIVVVSGYFKTTTPRDALPYNLAHAVFLHFRLSPHHESDLLMTFLKLTPHEVSDGLYREIAALLDFIVAIHPRVGSFLGVLESSFSLAVY
jgi:hypothetical protein